jgi:phosphotransferase system enzyme I (PtsP)
MALIGLGFRSLSMSPAAIGPVKAMLLAMNVGEVSALLRQELKNAGSGDTLRPKLAHFAETHGIPV